MAGAVDGEKLMEGYEAEVIDNIPRHQAAWGQGELSSPWPNPCGVHYWLVPHTGGGWGGCQGVQLLLFSRLIATCRPSVLVTAV